MKLARYIFIILLFFFAIVFCVQNADTVTLHYYGLFDDLTAPLYIVVLAAVFLGIIIGIIGDVLTTMRLRLQLRRQTKEAEELRKKLASLKAENNFESEFTSLTPDNE